MTLALRYAVRSDVGLLREGNEDSAYAGPHLLAVADGMGGHAAGEVASAATIDTMAALDVERPPAELVDALANAVATANMRLQEMIISDPATEGMGTTLTALLWSEGHAALCHIGDSRAYLLRDGNFYQLTHDHTLVQSLVDEGRITEDDVATHPQRSLLLRALDGRTLADPDFDTYESQAGDRYLLCSDGLSGVVTEQTLHQALASVRDPEKAALQLVELALKGGGPDNITCIVADVVDSAGPTALSQVPVLAGAAQAGPPEQLRSPARQDSPAGRAGRLRRTEPQITLPDLDEGQEWGTPPGGYGEPDNDASVANGYPRPLTGHHDDEDGQYVRRSGPGSRRRWPIVTTLLAVLVVVLAVAGVVSWQWVQGRYFLGTKNGDVAIFQGVNSSIAGLSLSSPYQDTGVRMDQLPASQQDPIQATVSYGSLADAQKVVTNLRNEVARCKSNWQDLATWYQTQDLPYLVYEQKLNVWKHESPTDRGPAPKAPAAPGPNPGTPPASQCATAKAFGYPASALPPGTANSGYAATGTSTPSVTPTVSPSATRPASPSATPRATGTAATSPRTSAKT